MPHTRKFDWLKVILVQHKNYLTQTVYWQGRWLLILPFDSTVLLVKTVLDFLYSFTDSYM